MTDDRAWFVYRAKNGRINAAPTNVAGWAALLAVLAVIIGICVILISRIAPLGIGIAIAGQLSVMTIGFGLLVWLVKARGRRVD